MTRSIRSDAVHDGIHLRRDPGQDAGACLRGLCGQKRIERGNDALAHKAVRAAEVHIDDVGRDAAHHHHDRIHFADRSLQRDAFGPDQFHPGIPSQKFLLNPQCGDLHGLGDARLHHVGNTQADLLRRIELRGKRQDTQSQQAEEGGRERFPHSLDWHGSHHRKMKKCLYFDKQNCNSDL